MPIHDWSKVEAGIFHDFHQAWTMEIRYALNHGGLPPGYFAMTDQVVSGLKPDVITLQRKDHPPGDGSSSGGLAVADAPPRARFISQVAPEEVYARHANRIKIQHRLGNVVAMIEIVSPGNKNSGSALRAFIEKATGFLADGINLLVVDLFPPGPRDPHGIQKQIWDEISSEPFTLPPDKPLTVAAYCAGEVRTAYVEPVAVGDPLPSLPIFLDEARYVPAPLEKSYTIAWEESPETLREFVMEAMKKTGKIG